MDILIILVVFVAYILYMNHLLLSEIKAKRELSSQQQQQQQNISPFKYCSQLAGRCFLWPSLGWLHGWYGGYRYFDPTFGWFFY